ncbi:hypothetical protein J3Q64DRAFT_1825922, partial [Phycomyces blakesleeanus]
MLAKLTRLNPDELIGTIIDRKINSAMMIDLPRGVKRQLEEERFVPQGLEEDGSWPDLDRLLKKKKIWHESKLERKATAYLLKREVREVGEVEERLVGGEEEEEEE